MSIMAGKTMESKKPIRLIFTFNRQVLQFIVLNRDVFYADRVWKNWVRIVPKDERVIRKIKLSRNKIPIAIVNMFNLSKEELEEYNAARDDEHLAEIIINDARKKGCKYEGRKDE